MPGFIGLPEILLLGLVVLFVFGPKRLPEMARSMGHGLREFKDSVSGDKDENDRFTVPAEEPEVVLTERTHEPSAIAAPRYPSVVASQRTPSRLVRDDERVA
jgi:sec-independent protein translocase protein TatA